MHKTNKKENIVVSIGLILAVVVALVIAFSYTNGFCQHKETETVLVTEAECTKDGSENVVCVSCGEILETHSIPSSGHVFGEYTTLEEPSTNKNGVKAHTCEVCGFEEQEEFECPHTDTSLCVVEEPTCSSVGLEATYCKDCNSIVESHEMECLPHEKTHAEVTKEPTCTELGVETVICDTCGQTAEVNDIPMLEHTYGDWEYAKYATPFEEGTRSHTCSVCGHTETEQYTVELEDKHIYIPTAGINAKFSVNYFTQSAVDGNDIVYTERAYSGDGSNNPFVLGHDFGTLGTMHNAKVGDKIYLKLDGRIETYEIVISEYALECADEVNIAGKESGISVWSTLSSDLPSDYATFGKLHHGEDLWEDVDDGKTLHMYTCHKGEPHEASDGRRGRWIILANLIDTKEC